MKYMIEYPVRTAGLSHDQNFANQEALLNAFGKWAPEEGLTVHAFVSRLDNINQATAGLLNSPSE